MATIDPPLPETAAPAAARNVFWDVFDAAAFSLLILAASAAAIPAGLDTPLWLLVYAVMLLRISLSWQAFAPVLLRNKAYFFYPAALTVSVVWSLTPGPTLTGGVQTILTVLFCIFVGWRYSQLVLVRFLFWFSLIMLILSLAHLIIGIFPWPSRTTAGAALGLFPHKSMLARQSILCVVTGVALLMLTPRISLLNRVIVLLGFGLALAAVLMSKSMTNVLLLPLAIALLLVLSIHRLPRAFSLVCVGLAVILIAFLPLGFALLGVDPVQLLFDSTGKDATLTGRTILWDTALGQIPNQPFFGLGYRAFWQSPQFAVEHYQMVLAGNRSFTFHNFILEILVNVGLFGLVAMAVFLARSLRQQVRLLRKTGAPQASCCLALSCVFISVALIVPGLFGQHDFMLMAICIFGVSAGEEWRATRR